jgi:phytoene/squalene synthetase
MSPASKRLARSITWSGSKQTYFTGRFLVDRKLSTDFFRAYAYFRWIDDVIDLGTQGDSERHSFIKRQKGIIDSLYSGEVTADLSPEEALVADVVRHDQGKSPRLQSFVQNMFAIVEFDTFRRGRVISHEELDWYSNTLSRSVTDGIEFFIGNRSDYPDHAFHYSAALGAHISHLLRDMRLDVRDGYINIPEAFLAANGVGATAFDSEPYREWVRMRVGQAGRCLQEGKQYLDTLTNLRCKLAGHLYVARFESILKTIERDNFLLREGYGKQYKFATGLKMVAAAVQVIVRHATARFMSLAGH